MKFNQTQKDILRKGYAKAFNSTELQDAFVEEYKEFRDEVAKEMLVGQGFPNDVDPDKVDVEVKISQDETSDSLVENLEEGEKIPDIETFSNVAEDVDFYIDDILDNVNLTRIDVAFSMEAEEYLEKHPNVKHFAKVIERKFDRHKLEEYLREDENFVYEQVYETAKEEGFEEGDLSIVSYDISDLELKGTNSEIAERILNSGYKDEGEKVTDFMKVKFYKFIVKHKLYNVHIRITTDINDLEEY
ncbi:hypothetical protein [Staphylococcus succinus]|uniref:hypothetical protein n=1 Tax=Staphylococcus succinus TaxID=61015 RepID=UPI000E68E45E|nr:hypothetical protein [Staphylococcus succinus]RIN27704.1 hypothetical protein BU067_01475 [Staphylococcus succinus]